MFAVLVFDLQESEIIINNDFLAPKLLLGSALGRQAQLGKNLG